MKSRDILNGIAVRAAVAMPIVPKCTALSYRGIEDFETLTHSLSEEFPFLYQGKDEFDSAEVEKFDGIFAWIVEQLRKFPNGAPDPERRLVDILALTTMLEGDPDVWGEISQAIPRLPPLLLDGISKLFTDTKPDGRAFLERAGYSPEQISIALDDIARKDWKSVESTMDQLSNWLWLPLKSQSAAALHQYDRARLQDLVDRTDDLFEVAAYSLRAPVAQALALALTSRNWTFKFWAFHRSAIFAAAGNQSYPLEWETLLTQAAAEPDEWPRWLAVLNEYPSRYPQIQISLGSALVGASDEALDAYVWSISKNGDFGRQQLAHALDVFRAKASLPVRQKLWTSAFNRWKAWDFGCDENSKSVFQVVRSSFDFPVMGYLTECLSTKDLADMVTELEMRAAALERAWYSDSTVPISERYKLISTYQLLAHAKAVLAGAPEWLAGEPLYKPCWEDGSDYRSLKYDLDMGKATF